MMRHTVFGLIALAIAPSALAADELVQSDIVRDNARFHFVQSRPGLVEYLRRRFPKPNPTEIGKNHRLVKTAFGRTLSHANKATVRLFRNERLLAMGAVVSRDGFILSKASQLTTRVSCRFWDGRDGQASVVAVDREHDLALLRTDMRVTRTVNWQSGGDAPVGTLVAATAGFGDVPLAVGVVSVATRAVRRQQGFLVGIVLGNDGETPRIRKVAPHTPAQRAGLKPGDVITRVNGRSVKTDREVIRLIRPLRPGNSVELEVSRGKQELTVRVELGRASDFQPLARLPSNQDLSRRQSGFPSVFQHDTVLQSNHCGGPLVNLDGHVVGINIARASRVASYGVPASVVVSVLDRLQVSSPRN